MNHAQVLAMLRHAYEQCVNGGVKDSAQAARFAEGLISPVIRALERQGDAVAAEREACAQVCDELAELNRKASTDSMWQQGECAAAIRARGA